MRRQTVGKLARRTAKAFTLIELLVVMALMSVVGTVFFSYVAQASRDNQKLQSLAGVQTDLSFALDRANRVLRSTTQIISADAISLKVLAYANAADVAPSQIYFYISNTRVVYEVTPPSGSAPNYNYDPADLEQFTLLPKVTNNVATPLFSYYDQANTSLTLPVTIANVHAITFSPSALDSTNVLTTAVTAQTFITLRNFKTNL